MTACNLHKVNADSFEAVKRFYNDVTAEMQGKPDSAGWIPSVYPSENFLKKAIDRRELYALVNAGELAGCVVLNSDVNGGYGDVQWSAEATGEEILAPHALAVSPEFQGSGIGTSMVEKIIEIAERQGKKAIRLDILSTNTAAEALYIKAGFSFVAEKELTYFDTYTANFKLFELCL